MHELRTLFDMLRSSIEALPAPARGGAGRVARLRAGGPEGLSVPRDAGAAAAAADHVVPAGGRRAGPEAGPEAPRVCFDLDGNGGGLELPHWMPADVVGKGAFSVGMWLRLESGGTDGGLLFSMVDRQAEGGSSSRCRARSSRSSSSSTARARARVPASSSLLRRTAPPSAARSAGSSSRSAGGTTCSSASASAPSGRASPRPSPCSTASARR